MAKQRGEGDPGLVRPEEGRARPRSSLASSINRRAARPDRRAVVWSVAFHVVLIAGILVSGFLYGSTLPDFVQYRVRLISPPPQVEGPRDPAQVAIAPNIVTPPKPDPEPVREAPKPKPKPPEPKPPEATPDPPKPAEPEKKDDPKPVTGERADPKSTGGENIDVNMDGRDFPFPGYLENITLQLFRYFRWTGDPKLEGTVAFFIARDGSVGVMQVIGKSGDFNFDLQMLSAVERAGKAGVFGPLPDGWAQDRLWVRFTFLKPGG